MLDYEAMPVPGNQPIDFLGLHYLHQLNPWLYLGLGIHMPLIHGDYGGFMAADATIHVQHRIFGHSFVDAGGSFGGGGGGSSITQSRELSGKGGFIKGYIGLGYDFGAFSAGVNYDRFRFLDARINHAQMNFFIQKPISFTTAPYAYAGEKVETDDEFREPGENLLTLELNNMFQIKPKGSNKNTIHLLSLQFSHFLTENRYLFFGLDVGYAGLPLYNQALGGMGYRVSIAPRVNLYGQIGVGSGGYAPAEIDTGPGLLVYPKFAVEYLLNDKLGLSLSSGYLFSPKGSSKNFTLGTAMNYHLSTGKTHHKKFLAANELMLRGFRLHIFQQTEFNVRVGNKPRGNIDLLSAQFDYVASDHWYVPIQASVAYNAFLGYPGYGEIFTGIGIQSSFSAKSRFQNYFQLLIGANALGVVLKPSLGSDYSLSDSLALYGQIGKIIPINKNKRSADLQLDSYTIGFGLTYRFSLLDSPAR